MTTMQTILLSMAGMYLIFIAIFCLGLARAAAFDRKIQREWENDSGTTGRKIREFDS